MLDVFLQQALRGWSSIFLCGGSPADFQLALQAVLKFEPAGENWLNVEVAPDLAAADFLRAALRQDPDCIVLDQRGSECLEMQLQAACTGPRSEWRLACSSRCSLARTLPASRSRLNSH